MSVDVEDWYSSAVLWLSGRIVAPTSAVVRQTMTLLELFQQHRVRATWFVLGEVAASFPSLVRDLAQSGQEIGVHGFHHHKVFNLTREQFREAVRRGKDVVEQAGGVSAHGHRAPAFSIDARSPWAMEVLREAGFHYDSSLFEYGVGSAASGAVRWRPFAVPTPQGPLWEVPLSVADFPGLRLPCSGGGYLRHFPLLYTRCLLSVIERRQRRAVFYLHPCEVDSSWDAAFIHRHLSEVKPRRLRFVRWSQFRGRDATVRKLGALLRTRTFAPIREVFPMVGEPPSASPSSGGES